MSKMPQQITDENFDEAVDSISSIQLSVKQKDLIKKLARPIGSILFVLLSLILVYGLAYSFSSSEDMLVFDKFAPLTKFWLWYSNIFTSPDMVWYISWSILIVATFVVPLVISAIITIIVKFAYKPNNFQINEGSTSEKAKNLHNIATDLSKCFSNYEDPKAKTPFKLIFILLIAAFLAYSFFVFKMFSVKMLFGFAVVMLLLYWLYGLIFNAFYALNKLFYKKTYISGLTKLTDEYWLSVDPQEKERRKQEEERKKQKEESKPKKKQKPARPVTTTPPSSSSSASINKYDSFTWTASYVRSNENQCSDITLSVLKVAKEMLEEGDYSGAAAGFDKVVHALELLLNCDESYYMPPLFANCYALSRIFAFGLNNKESARKYAEKAYDYATKCNNDTARRDSYIIRDFRDALRSDRSLSSITDEWGEEFPFDILSMG